MGYKNMLMQAYPQNSNNESRVESHMIVNQRRPFNHCLLYPLESKHNSVSRKRQSTLKSEVKQQIASSKIVSAYLGLERDAVNKTTDYNDTSTVLRKSAVKESSKSALEFIRQNRPSTANFLGKRKKIRRTTN